MPYYTYMPILWAVLGGETNYSVWCWWWRRQPWACGIPKNSQVFRAVGDRPCCVPDLPTLPVMEVLGISWCFPVLGGVFCLFYPHAWLSCYTLPVMLTTLT